MTDFPWGIIYERMGYGGTNKGDRQTEADNKLADHYEEASQRLADAVSRYLVEREAA